MQDAVLKIQKLGAPPEGFEDCDTDRDEDTYQLWDDWVDAVCAIQWPVTWEEAEVLIKCCPTDRMSGVEWTMLHCIESVPMETAEDLERYRDLVAQCNSDLMKEMLLDRLKNC